MKTLHAIARTIIDICAIGGGLLFIAVIILLLVLWAASTLKPGDLP